MTQNQLTYWANQETARSNLAKETETHRANVARETEENRSNRAREYETNRSNVQNEILKRDAHELDAWNALWGKNGAYYTGNGATNYLVNNKDYKGNPVAKNTVLKTASNLYNEDGTMKTNTGDNLQDTLGTIVNKATDGALAVGDWFKGLFKAAKDKDAAWQPKPKKDFNKDKGAKWQPKPKKDFNQGKRNEWQPKPKRSFS